VTRRTTTLLKRPRRHALQLIRPDTDLVLRLHDGRRLGVAEFGHRSALPVIYCHGFLGSRLEPGAGEIGDTNIIAFDRPGYGRSDLQRLPSLRGWGADVGEALVQLGVGECIVVGISTGAPYALAVAAALGRRVRRVILAGGVAGPEVLETGGGTALVLSLLGRRGSRAGKLLHQIMRVALATRLDRRLVALAVATEKAALERQGLAPALLEARLLQSLRTGSRRNLRGPLADARLVAQPWDFTLGEIQSAVQVLHGTNDPVVPPVHAHWYAAHLPRARLEMVPGELHISLCITSAGRVQEALRELACDGEEPEGRLAALAGPVSSPGPTPAGTR
jgi:pimeloyl-ACP methyl ester carboxylesterase